MTAPEPAELDQPAPIDPAPRGEDAGRLDLAAALAELDRAPAHLLAVEAAHGFTFGILDPGRPATIAVACTSPGCARQGRLYGLHDDTVQPVHCGECGGVVHCDHLPELRRERAGSLAAVVEHLITACTRCGTELDRRSRDLGPLPLSEIPVALLDREL